MATLRSTVDVIRNRKKQLDGVMEGGGQATVAKKTPSYTHETAPPEVRMTDEWLNEEMRRKKAGKKKGWW